MNNLMLHARRFLVIEQPLVCIGVSPSSFGWYYQNQQESSGNSHLNIESGMQSAASDIAADLLPGTSMNTNWLTSVIELRRANAQVSGLVAPGVDRYRRKQVIYFMLLIALGKPESGDARSFYRQLHGNEKLLYVLLRPLTWMGAAGIRLLQLLHIASQKRPGYILRALKRKLLGSTPGASVPQGENILATETLLQR
jgi:hypothetical protein